MAVKVEFFMKGESKLLNKDLRIKIVELIRNAKEGHIPSSFSIVDIIDHLYGNVLSYKIDEPEWLRRDFFILSKGHGCAGLYVVLHKYGLVGDKDIELYSRLGGVLGGHPEISVPHIEASTGSLGHGFPTAMGIALGLKIQERSNRVFALLGDGECHEGTIWESANVAANQKLGNLCAIVDWNQSGAQLMPEDDLPARWKSFGWDVQVIDGHDKGSISNVFNQLDFSSEGKPSVVIAKTIKGKGVSFIEGHGPWHHKIPNEDEFEQIMVELS
jgi:transketolase